MGGIPIEIELAFLRAQHAEVRGRWEEARGGDEEGEDLAEARLPHFQRDVDGHAVHPR